MVTDLSSTSQVLRANAMAQFAHLQSLINDLKGVVQIFDLRCLVDHLHGEDEELLVKDRLYAELRWIGADGGTFSEDREEAESLSHCFVIIGAKQTTKDA